MFNNQIFDSWLNKKSDEILSKVDRETISTEDMIILILKAQTNHFYHTDIDMKKGLSDLDAKIEKVIVDVDKRFAEVDKNFERVNARIDSVERRLESLDHKIDNRFMWTIGITITMSLGIYLKLFLG